MKRYLVSCLLFLFIFPAGLRAQFTRSLIIKTADAKIRQLLGDGLCAHIHNMDDMRYTYTDDSGKIQAAHITEEDTITRGKLDRIYVNYVFEYQFPELRDTTIYGEFNIVLDRFLQTARQPDISFIPEYLWHVKENDFLPHEQIAKIAKDNGLDKHKPGITYFSSLEHIKKEDKFVYVIQGVPEKFDLKSKEYEIMVIDARTGVMMNYKFGDEGRKLERELMGH
jgi:DNA polymerase IIIc chi subunit